MRRLKKILAASRTTTFPMVSLDQDENTQEEIENLLIGMFRDLPQDQRQTILDIVAEVYSLTKRAPC